MVGLERGSLHTELKLKYSTCRLFSSMADLNLRQVRVIEMRFCEMSDWLGVVSYWFVAVSEWFGVVNWWFGVFPRTPVRLLVS